jgi:hypothetical protein
VEQRIEAALRVGGTGLDFAVSRPPSSSCPGAFLLIP